MSSKAIQDNTLGSDAGQEAQEAWKNLGVPLRKTDHALVHKIANKQGMKAATWARIHLLDALARASRAA